MIPVESHLQDLVCQVHSTAREIESVINVLKNTDLTDNEKMHKVSNLMLDIDISLLANRKQFNEIIKGLRGTC